MKLSESAARALLDMVKSKGYRIFTRPFELNLIGLRTGLRITNTFDDSISIVWHDDLGKLHGHSFAATTEPGKYWLEAQTKAKRGVALLRDGQYLNAYALGLHQNKYEALVQVKDVTVDRAMLNQDGTIHAVATENGKFGINIHRATRSGTAFRIDRHSAGCQVIAAPEDYEWVLAAARLHKARYGNLTYTLIDRSKVEAGLSLVPI